MSNAGADQSDLTYDQVVERFTAAVAASVPAGAVVAVVSKGDSSLLNLAGRSGWHFPQGKEGAYAGAYPQTGEEAVVQLEQLRQRGAQFLAFPSTSAWWLEHALYAAFQSHLQLHYLAVSSDRSAAVIFDVRQARRHLTEALPAAEISHDAAVELVLATGVVNPTYYQEQTGGTFGNARAAVDHYLRIGAAAGFNLHPLFDTRFYLRANPTIPAAGWNPLVHYLHRGYREGREPHPLFDSLWYTGQCGATGDEAPLAHYLRTRRDTQASPNPLFDVAFYGETDAAPLEHYVTQGRAAQRLPSPLAQTLLQASGLPAKPTGKPQVWVVLHDGGQTGAPLIGAQIIKHLVRTHDIECTAIFVRGGPLEDELRPFARLLNLESVRHHSDRPAAVRMLLDAARPTGAVYGICNSIETRGVMDCFHQLSIPFLSLIHEFPEYVPDGVLETVHRQSDRLVFPAAMVRDANAEKISGASAELSVIPQGVFDPQFPQGNRVTARENLRQELGLDPDTFIVLGCGSVDLRKGCDQFVAIAKAFTATHPGSSVAFVWVGELASVNAINSFQFWLMQDINAAGLQDRVRFIGPRKGEALAQCFLAADAFLMVSRQDPFPCVVLEAMAASLPVICFDGRIGSTEILRDGSGLVIPYLDVRTAAEQVYALQADSSLREQIGRRARDLVAEKFQFSRYVENLRDLLPNVAKPLSPDLELTPLSRRPLRLPEATLAAAKVAPLACTGQVSSSAVASIVMVTYNQLPFTRLCLSSLLANTDSPSHEIIVVDNASTDGTPEFLHQLSALHRHVRIILNAENRGFAAANNQGLAVARGETLVLLNNDTLVPPGWLAALIEPLRDRSVGLVGPVTNRIGNEAEIKTSYRSYGQMLSFAQQRALDHAGQLTDIRTPCMYCLAMRRDVFNTLGPLDESFGIGMFEDDDYAMRARAGGYRVVCAEGCFVHHFGSASFGELSAVGTYGPLFEANRRRFEAKWGRPWTPHAIRPDPAYTAMVAQVREQIREHTAPDAEVLVISKGDDGLLGIPGRQMGHFPQAADRGYAGHYPANSDSAIEHLNSLQADYLVVPANAAWWLDHYPGFGQHLRRRSVHRCEACEIFSLVAHPAAMKQH